MKDMLLKAQLILALSLAAGGASAVQDPTEPPKARVSSGAEIQGEETRLAWVRINGRHSIAWYGGTAVKLDDPVEGGRVTAIHEDHIVISRKGVRRAVYLLDQSTRTKLQAPPSPVR